MNNVVSTILDRLVIYRPRGEEVSGYEAYNLLIEYRQRFNANIYIVLNYRRKFLEHAYGYYKMELKLAFSSL
jgi:hypothetical protein